MNMNSKKIKISQIKTNKLKFEKKANLNYNNLIKIKSK